MQILKWNDLGMLILTLLNKPHCTAPSVISLPLLAWIRKTQHHQHQHQPKLSLALSTSDSHNALILPRTVKPNSHLDWFGRYLGGSKAHIWVCLGGQGA